MVQSVELVLDEELDRAVREEWQVLVDAGLPSQARHTGASNRPHVTLAVADRVEPATEDALARVDLGLPAALRLGGLLVFGGRTSVLSRVVVPSMELVRVHRDVHAALAGMPGIPHTVTPGRWTPHVTLARRLDPSQLAAALAVLADRPRELVGRATQARRWDSDARETWDVGGP